MVHLSGCLDLTPCTIAISVADSLLSLDGSLALPKEVETPVSLMWWSASPLGNFLMNSGDESCRQVCKSTVDLQRVSLRGAIVPRKVNPKITTIE